MAAIRNTIRSRRESQIRPLAETAIRDEDPAEGKASFRRAFVPRIRISRWLDILSPLAEYADFFGFHHWDFGLRSFSARWGKTRAQDEPRQGQRFERGAGILALRPSSSPSRETASLTVPSFRVWLHDSGQRFENVAVPSGAEPRRAAAPSAMPYQTLNHISES